MTEQEEKRKAMEDLSRADQARELISHPLYQEAIMSISAAMYAEFESTKLDDAAKRHELWQRMQLMKQFQGKFEAILKRGKKATQTLTLLEKAKELLR